MPSKSEEPGPAAGTDVFDGGGQGPTGIDHLAEGLGRDRTGGGLAQATHRGEVIDQAPGEAFPETLVFEVGCGVPGGEHLAEAFRLTLGRQLEFADEALVTGAGEGMTQQGMGAAGGAGVAQRVVAPGRAAGAPAALLVARLVGIVA